MTADRTSRALLFVKVTPNARRSELAGWTSDEQGRPVLLVKLKAPPVEGKANAELTRFLSEALDCPQGQIVLVRGGSSRQKSLEIPAEVVSKLPSRQL